jgi:hypothetical protein
LRAYVVFILYDKPFDSYPRRPWLKSEIEHNGSLVSHDVSTSSPSHSKTGLLIHWERMNLFLTEFNQKGQAEKRNYFKTVFRKPPSLGKPTYVSEHNIKTDLKDKWKRMGRVQLAPKKVL